MKKIIKMLIPTLSLMALSVQGSESIVIHKKKVDDNQLVNVSSVINAKQFSHTSEKDGTQLFTASNMKRQDVNRTFDVALSYKINGDTVDINKLTLLDVKSKDVSVELSGSIPRNAITSASSPIGLVLAAKTLEIKTSGKTDLSSSWIKLGLYDLLPADKLIVVHERIHLVKNNDSIVINELFFSVTNVFDFHFTGNLINESGTWKITDGALTTNITASGKLSELANKTLINTQGKEKKLYDINFLAIFSQDLNNVN
jgi:hypothetical protein